MQQPDNKPGNYYVSVRRDDGQSRFLLGPYLNNHAGALAAVEPARKMAQEMDVKAAFYSFGTARVDIEAGKPVELGILNKYFNADLSAVYVLTPFEEFKRAYREALVTNRAAFPSHYRWPASDLDKVVDAMMAALKAGNAVQVVVAPQLFPTPAAIAAKMVSEAAIEPGMCVLEPSAGTGNLVKAVLDTVDTEVLGYEINRGLCSQLERSFPGHKLQVRCRDFLEVTDFQGQYPRVVMNPPFENGADIKHIKHALTFVAPGGRLVALCAAGSRQKAFADEVGASWEDLPAGSFKEQGTSVNVAMIVVDV